MTAQEIIAAGEALVQEREAQEKATQTVEMKVNWILMINIIREVGTMIDGKGYYASLDKVRKIAKNIELQDVDTLITEMWNASVIRPELGNPGHYDNKSDLYRDSYGDVYCSLSEY